MLIYSLINFYYFSVVVYIIEHDLQIQFQILHFFVTTHVHITTQHKLLVTVISGNPVFEHGGKNHHGTKLSLSTLIDFYLEGKPQKRQNRKTTKKAKQDKRPKR